MPETEKNASWDFPKLAREMVATFAESSPIHATSKLPAGLYVIATPIGNRGDITLRALATLASLDHLACEDTRTTGSLLAAYGIKTRLISYTEHNDSERTRQILDYIHAGDAVGLCSDAGLPLISDPGQRLVAACHDAGVPVTVLPGANAALTALVGSGLATGEFHFAGFLPTRSKARRDVLRSLNSLSATLIFYESPGRLTDMLADAIAVMGDNRPASVARELTKMFEEQRTATLAELHAHYTSHPPKGEIVLIISGNVSQEETSAQDLDTLITQSLATLSVRDAAAAVAEMTGMKKKDVYARVLELVAAKK